MRRMIAQVDGRGRNKVGAIFLKKGPHFAWSKERTAMVRNKNLGCRKYFWRDWRGLLNFTFYSEKPPYVWSRRLVDSEEYLWCFNLLETCAVLD